MRVRPFVDVLAAIALYLLSPVNAAYINILVNYDGETQSSFTLYGLRSYHFANVPAEGLMGHLFEPTPRNACSNIPPPPPLSSDSWFALVSDYPACPSQMVSNVRNAGYKLIITYNDSHRDLSHEVFDSGFPVVSVAEDYAQYLKNYTLSNSTNDPITLTVTVSMDPAMMTVPVILFYSAPLFVLLCSFTIVYCCCKYCNKDQQNLRRIIPETNEQRVQLAWQETHNQRIRLARQELIQSILRHLQELQLDMALQCPLDTDEINQLPTRPYTDDRDEPETCAICISDFSSGESVRVLPCTHIFHPQCIDEWLTGHSSLCPLCKAEVREAQSPSTDQQQYDDTL